jgi:solute carrier family 35, member E1
MFGVALASANELSFSWFCFGAGVMSNIFAAARGVFGKMQMCGDDKCVELLSPENYYAILTILSLLMLAPVTLFIEGERILNLTKISNYAVGVKQMLISGLLFYLYNELSFKALNNLSPVSHALANTVKRIVIIVSSVIFLGEKISYKGVIFLVSIIFSYLYFLSI